MIETTATAADGDVWVVCKGNDYTTNKVRTTLYRIDGSTGSMRWERPVEISLPIGPEAWPWRFALASSRNAMVLFVTAVSGNHGQNDEGTFMVQLENLGRFAPPVRVASSGASPQEVFATSDGSFLLTAASAPSFFAKIDARGAAVWRHALSQRFVASASAKYPDDSMCSAVQVQGKQPDLPHMQLIWMSASGVVTKQIPLQMAQGAAADGPDGACALLYIPAFNSAKRRMTMFSATGQRLWDKEMPFESNGGRTFEIQRIGAGFVIAEFGVPTKPPVVLRITDSGEISWSGTLPPGVERIVWGDRFAFLFQTRGASLRVIKIEWK